jgi:ATP-dependent RNA helicase RhlE
MSSQSFADLGVSKPVVAALAARGIETPFAVQNLVIADVLAGCDVLAQSPTGSGKTLAFGVPLADRIQPSDRRAAALVLAPTRELATQIVDELLPLVHARALKIAAVYGGVGIERQARRARDAHIIVATPGRLEDLIDRRVVTLEHIRMLVVDEGDRMLDMGFRPVLDRIVAQTPRERQTLFFSATLEGAAGAAAREYTRDPRRHTHAPAPEKRGAVDHRFVHLTHEEKLPTLVTELRDPDHGLTLVFVRTKRGADRLVKRLKNSGVKAVAMHGDKTQSQRQKALASFETGRVKTLVATDVAARGIDVENVTRVINFDVPDDRDAYVHRIGRTGRAGRTGAGVSFVMADQMDDMQRIAAELGLSGEFDRTAPRKVRPTQSPSSTHVRRQRGRPQRTRSSRRSRSNSG